MTAPRPAELKAVVFDLIYTLIHPGEYPGGGGRVAWLARLLGVDARELGTRFDAFDPILDSGQAPRAPDGTDPVLHWIHETAAELGAATTEATRAAIEQDWDRNRREGLLSPPGETITTLRALRARGFKLGILSNTHAAEMKALPRSPLPALVDAITLSDEIRACKPAPAAYAHILNGLGVAAAEAAYVGDGGNDELAGAKAAGFSAVILAERYARAFHPGELPRLRSQSDTSVATLEALIPLLSDLAPAHPVSDR